MAHSGTLPIMEAIMRISFVGITPDTPDNGCPAVYVDEDTGDIWIQGETVTDWLWRFRLAPPWRLDVAPPGGWTGYGVLMAV
jgi:hypothetical protein